MNPSPCLAAVDESLTVESDGSIRAPGWSARLLGPDLLQYCRGPDVCLVNLGWEPVRRARAIYVSEALSPWFPLLGEHLMRALPLLPGRWAVV